MQQIDTPENTQFKYLYCNSFTWLNPLENEQYSGHPKEKTIYRGWYNSETKSYRIILNPGIGTYFKNLKETDSFPQGYVCDFEEVTRENILKFKQLTEENLSELLGWLEINNADLKERMGFTSPIPGNTPNPQIIAIVQNINQEARQEQEAQNAMFQGFMQAGDELININPAAFEKIWTLIVTVLDEAYKIEEGPLDSDYLRHGEKGLAININEAYKCLNRYAGKDRRTNENPEDLYQAMTHIITELVRREYNNLDNE